MPIESDKKEQVLNKYVLLILLTISTTVFAGETRYITDQLEVTLRSGQSTKHQIVRMLPSGSAIEILEAGEDGAYTRIRTEQGTEGWVLSHYLDEQPSARQRLDQANNRLKLLDDENKQLKNDLAKIRAENRDLSKEKGLQTQLGNDLQQELNRIKRVSSDTLNVDKENQSLKQQLLQIQMNYDQSQQQISALQDSTARDWFMVGGGVILIGILIGLIIPKIRWKKKSEWGNL
jgi:SH3 domain protein